MDWSTIFLVLLTLSLICALFGYFNNNQEYPQNAAYGPTYATSDDASMPGYTPGGWSDDDYAQAEIDEPSGIMPYGIENASTVETLNCDQIGDEIDQIGGRGGRGSGGRSGGRGSGGRGSGGRGWGGQGSGGRGWGGRGWGGRGWGGRGWGGRGWGGRGWGGRRGWGNRGWNNWNSGWGNTWGNNWWGWPYASSAWWPTTTVIGTNTCANLAATQCANSLDFTTCYNRVLNNCVNPTLVI
jgi:hypothetical protein